MLLHFKYKHDILSSMLIIRLQRVGRTNDPSFRLVVVESKRSAKSGKFLEILGSYDARQKKTQFKDERIKYWLLNGVQLSPTAHNLLVGAKIIDAKKINVVRAPKPLTKPTEGV